MTVGLSATGAVKAYNLAGNVDLIIDIVGYYEAAATGGATGPAGPTGPTGPTGATGPSGATGARGVSAWEVVPAGTLLTGEAYFTGTVPSSGPLSVFGSVSLPALARTALTNTAVNFDNGGTADVDAACTGSFLAPTAPTGKVCIYYSSSTGINNAQLAGQALNLNTTGFGISLTLNGTGGTLYDLQVTWAYQA